MVNALTVFTNLAETFMLRPEVAPPAVSAVINMGTSNVVVEATADGVKTA